MITVETHQQMDSLLGKLTQSIIIMGPRGKKFTFLATKKNTFSKCRSSDLCQKLPDEIFSYWREIYYHGTSTI